MNQMSFGYPRQLRLLNSGDFRTVFDQVDVKAPSSSLLLLARFNEHTSPRLGFILSKKNVRHAVQRNRVKRLTRDYFRRHQHQLPNLDIIFMGRKGIDELSNAQILQLLEKQFSKLSKRAKQNK